MPLLRARRFAALLLAAGLALVLASGLAACGGSADDDPPPAPSGTAPPTAAPAEPPVPVESPATATPTTTAETAQTPIVTPEPPAPLAESSPAPAPAPEPPAAPVESPAPDSSTPPAEATETSATPFLYDTYDLSGTVAEPGHYAFLTDPDDPASVVTTYEGLRDGTATALLIHTHDAHGVSQAALYDTVEPGDLFEWRQAADCFVRYTVNEVKDDPAGDPPRTLLGVAWMTYAFTGCSGAISTTGTASVQWGPLPNLGGTSLTAPVRHGIGQIVPEGWTGAVEPFTFHDPPDYNTGDGRYTEDIAAARLLPYWREPVTPSPFTFLNAHASAESVAYGYVARWRGLEITGEFAASRGVHTEAVWRPTATTRALVETRVIDGRPAIVVYSPPGPMYEPFLLPIVLIYDPATQARYQLNGYNNVFRDDIDTLIAVARSLFENPPRLLYDTHDLTGAVAEPGHYTFLEDPDDPASAVTTYEGLRDGTAAALLIHTHDAHGISHTDLYATVEPGDLFEWRQASDCFVRYTVTEVPAPAAGAATRMFGVAWMTYAFTGCGGAIAAAPPRTLRFGDLPNLGGTSLTVPIRHGSFQIVPNDWTGATEEPVYHRPPTAYYSSGFSTTTLSEARTRPYWREPALPEGFTFSRASSDPEGIAYGYDASYRGPHGGLGLRIMGAFARYRGWPERAVEYGGVITETRVIANRPAIVIYEPPGPTQNPFTAIVAVYDAATEGVYLLDGGTERLLYNIDALIAIARSLFEPPNAP